MLDVKISGGSVVDGTGAARRQADVGIRDGRVVQVGNVGETAARTIDADGLIVAPGFVDIHTHYDAQAFWDPALTPSPLHGVTTIVGGNCGFTIAPLAASEADYLMRMLARVEGMPLESLEAGVPWDWQSFGEYLDRLDGTLAVNAGFLVGPLRVATRRHGRPRPRTCNRRRRGRDVPDTRRVARSRRAGLLVVAGADAQRRRRRTGPVTRRNERRARRAVARRRRPSRHDARVHPDGRAVLRRARRAHGGDVGSSAAAVELERARGGSRE